MTENQKPRLAAQPAPGYDPQVGEALWRLQDARARTLTILEEVAADLVDQDVEGNTLGTILYHLALIEADWLYSEILVEPLPERLRHLFEDDDRDQAGILTLIKGQSMEDHLSRLRTIREEFLEALQGMDAEELNRLRNLDDYDVSPAWVLHHLAQHEAEHRSELSRVIDQARRST